MNDIFYAILEDGKLKTYDHNKKLVYISKLMAIKRYDKMLKLFPEKNFSLVELKIDNYIKDKSPWDIEKFKKEYNSIYSE